MLRSTAPILLALITIGCGDDSFLDPDPDIDTSVDPTTFEVTLTNTSTVYNVHASGIYNTPENSPQAAALLSGQSYVIEFAAAPAYPGVMGETRLHFVSMFVPSNDLFYAPDPAGIPLFEEDGTPLTGDVTDLISVWDAGTEADQPLNGTENESGDQKPHQPTDDTGAADPVDTIRLASLTYPLQIPDIDELLEADLSYDDSTGEGIFTLTITNVSDTDTLDGGPFNGAVPISPGVYAVATHADGDPGIVFDIGDADRDEGLADIAEDGDPTRLAASLAAEKGLTVVSSPGVWVVQNDSEVLFEDGEILPRNGLEAIAEDGDPSGALSALADLDDVASVGQIGAAPLAPGASTTFSITAFPGQRLGLATMFVPSNDLLFATNEDGIPLFDEDGNPRGGVVTNSISLWDAGTEENQQPGVGLDQVHLQDSPNTGTLDSDEEVRMVDDGFDYPMVTDVLEVEITVQ